VSYKFGVPKVWSLKIKDKSKKLKENPVIPPLKGISRMLIKIASLALLDRNDRGHNVKSPLEGGRGM
jgi:hypothetical protein